jgi:hypothetical protein
MSTIADDDRRVIAGVDTHKDFHVVVVLDELGRNLDTATFSTTTHSGLTSLTMRGSARLPMHSPPMKVASSTPSETAVEPMASWRS